MAVRSTPLLDYTWDDNLRTGWLVEQEFAGWAVVHGAYPAYPNDWDIYSPGIGPYCWRAKFGAGLWRRSFYTPNGTEVPDDDNTFGECRFTFYLKGGDSPCVAEFFFGADSTWAVGSPSNAYPLNTYLVQFSKVDATHWKVELKKIVAGTMSTLATVPSVAGSWMGLVWQQVHVEWIDGRVKVWWNADMTGDPGLLHTLPGSPIIDVLDATFTEGMVGFGAYPQDPTEFNYLAFEETFEDGIATGWTVVKSPQDGSWKVLGGAGAEGTAKFYSVGPYPINGDDARSLAPGTFGDGIYSCYLSWQTTQPAIGAMIVCLGATGNYYVGAWDSGDDYRWRFVYTSPLGVHTTLWSGAAINPANWPEGTWRKVSVKKVGTTFTIYLDDVEQATVVGPQGESGSIGAQGNAIGAIQDVEVCFDQIRVYTAYSEHFFDNLSIWRLDDDFVLWGCVEGYVKDEDGFPVAGAIVYADTYSTTSDANGYYTIPVPADFTYRMQCFKAAYSFQPYDVAVRVNPCHQTQQDFTGSPIGVMGAIKHRKLIYTDPRFQSEDWDALETLGGGQWQVSLALPASDLRTFRWPKRYYVVGFSAHITETLTGGGNSVVSLEHRGKDGISNPVEFATITIYNGEVQGTVCAAAAFCSERTARGDTIVVKRKTSTSGVTGKAILFLALRESCPEDGGDT